ncbi:uncharacterized protein LOC143597064 [Bidens hawaiensis]|uniref:uncharacterized protein LOC143597064 n=1 Tax=Bidens hawaiensis TaxID=980011 RepID=UPI00404A7A42
MAPPVQPLQPFKLLLFRSRKLRKVSMATKGVYFMMNVNQAQVANNVVNGTFLVNEHLASSLFDTNADRSFISSKFQSTRGVPCTKLSRPFSVEVTNGSFITIDSVIRDCILTLCKRKFSIDLIPIQMVSFDAIVGMDWLVFHRAEVVCYDKFIRISLANGKTLKIFGKTTQNLMSCSQSQKCVPQKYVLFRAQAVEKVTGQRKIQYIPVVCDFPKVIPNDVFGIPPIRPVEF